MQYGNASHCLLTLSGCALGTELVIKYVEDRNVCEDIKHETTL